MSSNVPGPLNGNSRIFDQETKHEIQATAVAPYHSLASKSVFLVPQVYCCSTVAYIHDDCWTTIGMKPDQFADIRASNKNIPSIKTKCPILCLAERQLCLCNHKVHFFLPCATSFRGGKLSDFWSANHSHERRHLSGTFEPSPQGLGQIVLGPGDGSQGRGSAPGSNLANSRMTDRFIPQSCPLLWPRYFTTCREIWASLAALCLH